MSNFLLLHADRAATLLADDPIVPADDVTRFGDVTALLDAATTLRDDAQEAHNAALAAAREEGFAAGHAEGRAAGEASIRDELLRLAQEDAVRAEAQRADLAKLALEVVRRIAGTIGAPDMIAGIAAQAAAQVAPETAATVRVHPTVVVRVTERLAGLRYIAVEADDTLAPDDCVVATPLGRTHAGLDTQIAQLERAWGLTK
ncbi:FliH/SctL family protein [Sphingomonas sp. SUN019]|uniref:FliH/SctL family protein n=1 Tax=Sphingomonas sp. SUN019 TaxID=2937788 RepID=UPI002164E540|nr:FliH/SctL family protein [Sphingomonas sp. SUN019]UVO50035.1 FliH/SctL family protein [Sphingomonas sp. SUN019]